MSNYTFNEHNVCTNPKRTVIVDTDKAKLVVKTCEVNSGWVCGYDYCVRAGHEGGAMGASSNSTVYSTEDDAVCSQLKYFEARYPEYFGAVIREYLSPKTMQLF